MLLKIVKQSYLRVYGDVTGIIEKLAFLNRQKDASHINQGKWCSIFYVYVYTDIFS